MLLIKKKNYIFCGDPNFGISFYAVCIKPNFSKIKNNKLKLNKNQPN